MYQPLTHIKVISTNEKGYILPSEDDLHNNKVTVDIDGKTKVYDVTDIEIDNDYHLLPNSEKDAMDLAKSIIEKNRENKEALMRLSKPIISDNHKLTFKFNFLTDNAGLFTLYQNSINKGGGKFSLLYSDDFNCWEVHFSDYPFVFQTPTGNIGLIHHPIKDLVNYINSLSTSMK